MKNLNATAKFKLSKTIVTRFTKSTTTAFFPTTDQSSIECMMMPTRPLTLEC
jgi:hypothetical protein